MKTARCITLERVAAMLLLAATQTVFSLNVVSYVKEADGVDFTLNAGKMKVTVCQADIMRVAYAPTAAIPARTSLCVNKTWSTPAFSTAESGDTITLQTSRLKVKVSRSTAAISFADLSNNTVLSEYDKSMLPVTVEGVATYTCNTSYNSPVNEALYGLGSHMITSTVGTTIMNYKGRDERIQQEHASKNHFYASIPFLVSSRGYGVFWDNYSRSNFYGGDANNTRYRYSSECGSLIDYYFFYGPGLDTVISLFRTATGKAPLLPKWMYGLIHSKDHYSTQVEMLAVKTGYRTNKIPVDCIVQDWTYWDPNPWGSHIFNATRYPNPKAMVDSLHLANIHTMISIWPLFEQGSANYTALQNAGALLASTTTFNVVDAHSNTGRSIYWSQLSSALLIAHGWDSWWCDASEPSRMNVDTDYHAVTTAMGKGAFYYNTYSFRLMDQGYTGWRRDIPGKRASLLTRSAFAGQQRSGAVTWNNDIECDFPSLSNSIPAGLNFQLSGNPNFTTDIGGYWGHTLDWSTPALRELFTRWLQYGAFCSIFRIHGGGSRELYSTNWDITTKANLLKTDYLRYRLLPYIYSLAWKTTNEDYTMQRHLVMDFRNDTNVYNNATQFMFGPAFLVSPIITAGAVSRSAYLPAGTWYDFWTGASVSGGKTVTAAAPLDKIPLHIRAGSIVPLGPVIQYATERSDSIELRVYPGANGSFTLYEDEGDNYNYESGRYATIPMTYDNSSGKVTIGARTGSFNGMRQDKVFSIVFVTPGHGVDIGKTAAPDCVINYTGVAMTACPGSGVPAQGRVHPDFRPGPVMMRCAFGTVVLPDGFKGRTTEVSIYSIGGRLLGKAISRHQMVKISEDFGLPSGSYIARVRVVE